MYVYIHTHIIIYLVIHIIIYLVIDIDIGIDRDKMEYYSAIKRMTFCHL